MFLGGRMTGLTHHETEFAPREVFPLGHILGAMDTTTASSDWVQSGRKKVPKTMAAGLWWRIHPFGLMRPLGLLGMIFADLLQPLARVYP